MVSLQYADDTILFSDCDDLYLRNLKSCLAWFEQLSGSGGARNLCLGMPNAKKN